MLNSGRRGKRAPDGSGVLNVNEQFNQTNYAVPTITSYAVVDVSYNPYDDIALNTAGGQSVVIYGSGFKSGITININGTNRTSTLLDENRVLITSPALSSGTYTIYASNTNGATAIYLPGLIYSGTPTWSTGTDLGTGYETTSFSQTLSASSDSTVTYALAAGNNLPSGVSLNSSTGDLTGTLPVESGSTTYQFTIVASDAELQDTTRQFSLTVNTDVVTWSSPSPNYVISSYEYSDIPSTTAIATSAAVGSHVLYSSNVLPSGVTLNANTGAISGTITTVGNTYPRFTATANVTNRSATRDVVFECKQDVVTWSSPASNYVISAYEYVPITNVTTVATSAAVGSHVLYSSNVLPTGITLEANTGLISGTMTTVGNTYPTLTSTANTTSRSATRNVVFECKADEVTWSNPSSNTDYTLSKDTAMSSITLSAASAAGFEVTYAANALPTGVSLSAGTISGTPSAVETVYTELTATAGTTNRTAKRYVSWTVSVASDTYWKNTTMLLSANAQTTFITDSSINNSQLTPAGTVRAVEFNPLQQGYYSNYFDGASYLQETLPSGGILIGTQDFSLEAWGYWTSFNYGTYGAPLISFLGATAGELMLRANKTTATSTSANFFNIVGSGTYIPNGMYTAGISGGTLYLNRWHHLAVSRISGVWNFYVDGVSISTVSAGDASLTLAFTNAYIGSDGASGGGYMQGYVSNARLLVGSSAYSGTSFTVPTTPLLPVANTKLLTAQSNRFQDTSSSNTTFTVSSTAIKTTAVHPFTTAYQTGTPYYSYFFDGVTDYIEIPNNTNNQLSGSTFTIEMWIHPFTSGTERRIFNKNPASVTGYLIALDTLDRVRWSTDSGNYVGTITAPINTWSHIAVTNDGTTTRLFVNGVLSASSTTATITSSSEQLALAIGARQYNGGNGFPGLISNVRMIKGQALYTGNFTPATSALTATSVGTSGANVASSITGTVSVLTCQDSTFKDNSPTAATITVYNQSKPVAISPFTPSSYTSNTVASFGSTYFNNTGASNTDWILGPTLPAFGTQNHTIEFWLWQTTSPQTYATVWRYAGGATQQATNDYYISTGASGGSVLVGGGGTWTVSMAFTVPSVNAWHHYAITRSGTTWKIFIDGVQAGTTTGNPTIAAPGSAMVLGTSAAGAANGVYIQGYMSDFRIVLGTALYTSAFVPPINSQLTAVANTQLLTVQSNNNANNSTFKDTSYFGNIVTRNGNPTQGTFSPYGDNWSIDFNGTLLNQYLNFPTATATALGGFNGNITTIEGWFFETVTSTTGYYNDVMGAVAAVAVNGRFQIGFGAAAASNSPSKVQFLWTTSTGTVDEISTTSTLPVNKWNHVAIVVDATGAAGSHTVAVYINGTRELFTGKNFSTQTFTYDRLCFGGYSTNFFNGYISNFRFTRATTNTVGYSGATITPPTSQLQPVTGTKLLFNSNRFVDSSLLQNTFSINGTPKISKFSPFGTVTVPKYYSTYFDGTGDYLQTPASSATTLIGGSGSISTTSTFTIECWIYQTQRQTYDYGCMIGDMGTNGSIYWGFGPNATGKLALRWNDGATKTAVGDSTIPLNTWTHIALSIDSGTIRMFVNGVLQTITGTSSTTNQSGTLGYLLVGGFYTFGTTYGYYGNISNLRITKSALYTSAFTPSTTPLTAVANTSLLTCQSSTLVDNSTNYLTLTAAGDAKPLPVSPFTPTASSATSYSPTVFGGSMYFDGTGDYLTTPYNLGTELTSGNFTIEFWMYKQTTGDQYIVHNRPTSTSAGWAVMTFSETIRFYFTGGTSVNTTATVPLNQWCHVALVNTGGTLKIYLNGVQQYSGAVSGANISTGTNLFIGCDNGPSFGGFFNGYMSDLRIMRVALYNSNFVPSETPATPSISGPYAGLLNSSNTATSTFLSCGTGAGIIDQTRTVDLETIVDAKVTNFSPYNGSYYSNLFNATDFLTVADNAAISVGSSDFTFECWINPTSFADNQYMWFKRPNTAAASGLGIGLEITTGNIRLLAGNSDTAAWEIAYITTSGVTLGKWSHVAVTRSSNTWTIYVNGTSVGSTTNSVVVDDTGVAYIGASSSVPAAPFRGYISNLRLVKGTAIVPSAGGPTAPLTAVSGTGLLTCQSNKFVDNSSNAFTLTKGGTPKVATQNPFQVNTGQSYYFDGTGDYLTAHTGTGTINFGTGDFTIETWVYFEANNSTYNPFIRVNGGSQLDFGFDFSVNQLKYSTSVAVLANSWTPTIGTWYHVALVRSSGNAKIYVNGVNISGAGVSDSFNHSLNSSTTFYRIGGSDFSGSHVMRGYLSDLRITKGVARTITVPTTPYILK